MSYCGLKGDVQYSSGHTKVSDSVPYNGIVPQRHGKKNGMKLDTVWSFHFYAMPKTNVQSF